MRQRRGVCCIIRRASWRWRWLACGVCCACSFALTWSKGEAGNDAALTVSRLPILGGGPVLHLPPRPSHVEDADHALVPEGSARGAGGGRASRRLGVRVRLHPRACLRANPCARASVVGGRCPRGGSFARARGGWGGDPKCEVALLTGEPVVSPLGGAPSPREGAALRAPRGAGLPPPPPISPSVVRARSRTQASPMSDNLAGALPSDLERACLLVSSWLSRLHTGDIGKHFEHRPRGQL